MSTDAHLVFHKPAGWPRESGMEGQPSLGTFRHVVELPGGGICMLRLGAVAEAARRHPTLTGRHVHSQSGVIRVQRRGGDGSMRWISGRVGDGSDAARGARPLTPGHAPARYPWAIVDIDLSRELTRFGPVGPEGYPPLDPTAAQRRRCAALQANAVPVLDRAIGSARIAAGPPPTDG